MHDALACVPNPIEMVFLIYFYSHIIY